MHQNVNLRFHAGGLDAFDTGNFLRLAGVRKVSQRSFALALSNVERFVRAWANVEVDVEAELLDNAGRDAVQHDLTSRRPRVRPARMGNETRDCAARGF